MISLVHPANLAATATVAQAAPSSGATGQVVVIGVPILIIALIAYLCQRHRRHTALLGSVAVLGFVAGVLLAGTALGATLATGVTQLITSVVGAIGGLFTG